MQTQGHAPERGHFMYFGHLSTLFFIFIDFIRSAMNYNNTANNVDWGNYARIR